MMNEKSTFLGEDGLIYCSVCKESKEAFYPSDFLFGLKKHPRQCACDRKEREEMERHFREKERKQLIERNRKNCFEEPEMLQCTFQNSTEDNFVFQTAKKYVSNWKEMKKKRMGYLLWGPVGTGKSYLARCVANALLDCGVTVKMMNFSGILNDLFAAEDKTEYIRCLMKYDLLIIDDLGAERNSEYATEIVFSVVDARYRSGKPLIITTNLSLVKMKSETDAGKRRIYDRILEMCVPMKMDGDSKREKLATNKIHDMKDILNL